MLKELFNLYAKKLQSVYSDKFKKRLETLRQIYINRKNAISEDNKNISRPHFIFFDQAEINEKARSWLASENEEKYVTQALLEWEFMTTINATERKLIEKGARLREKLMEECVQARK